MKRGAVQDDLMSGALSFAEAIAAGLGLDDQHGIERDHGFLNERLRPMRGLKSISSAAIFMRGHALMRNIRRGFYRVVEAVPRRLVFAWPWNRLAGAV